MELSEIQKQWPFLNIMHPAHLNYIKQLPYNTLQYFLRTIYELEPEKRHKIVQAGSYLLFYGDEEKEELLDLLNDKDRLFEEFGVKCIQVSKVFHEALLVMSITQFMLWELSRLGDKTNIDRIKSNLVKLADHLMREDERQKEVREDKFVDKLVDDATNLEETTEENYNLYVYFCENVLVRLAEQEKAWMQQLRERKEPENE